MVKISKCTASNSVALILNRSLWLCTIGNSESAAVFNISGVTGPVKKISASEFVAQTSHYFVKYLYCDPENLILSHKIPHYHSLEN